MILLKRFSVALALVFSTSLFAEEISDDVFQAQFIDKIEILNNEVTVGEGRTVSNRLRVCETFGVNPCRVYIIENKALLLEAQGLVDAVKNGPDSLVFEVNYTWDSQISWLKILSSVAVR